MTTMVRPRKIRHRPSAMALVVLCGMSLCFFNFTLVFWGAIRIDETSIRVGNASPLLFRIAPGGSDQDESGSDRSIRKWGCRLTQTPLIFVHIGKTGGGGIRVRFAASAPNYVANRSESVNNDIDEDEQPFYPIGPNKSDRAYFCHAIHPLYRANKIKANQGTIRCHATTPLGHAVACPATFKRIHLCRGCEPESETCHQVYVGHNFLGSEMHWLPQKILSKWWEESWLDRTSEEDEIKSYLQTLAPDDQRWCRYQNISRNPTPDDYRENYVSCSVPLATAVDEQAYRTVADRLSHTRQRLPRVHRPFDMNWSPIYASLPVLRTTVLREPFSWLVSKFFWHRNYEIAKCDNVDKATFDDGSFQTFNVAGVGWANRYALYYIFNLCGEDCVSRYEMGVASLEQMEKQAASNLRQSFAVVGILNDLDTFYDMVSMRVQYMDMSLHPEVQGDEHPSGNSRNILACRELYQDPSFQSRMKNKSPAIAAMERLYRIGLEVNRFQQEELQICTMDP